MSQFNELPPFDSSFIFYPSIRPSCIVADWPAGAGPPGHWGANLCAGGRTWSPGPGLAQPACGRRPHAARGRRHSMRHIDIIIAIERDKLMNCIGAVLGRILFSRERN